MYWLETTPKFLTRSSLCPQYVIQPARLASWISPLYRMPTVYSINDDEAVKKACAGRYASYRKKSGAIPRRSCSSDGIYRVWTSSLGQTIVPIVAQCESMTNFVDISAMRSVAIGSPINWDHRRQWGMVDKNDNRFRKLPRDLSLDSFGEV